MKNKEYIKAGISAILTIITLIYSVNICLPIVFKNATTLEQRTHTFLFITTLVCFIIFIFTMWNIVINIAQKLYRKDINTKKYLKYFGIYFTIMIVFLLLIWPGHWVWDEIFIIENTSNCNVFQWQSVITQIYYGVILLLIPHPVAITIIQIILISMIIAYIQTRTELTYNNKWLNLILYGVFLFPSIIINNLYVIRLTIYSYIMLLLASILIFDKINKEEISIAKAILLIILSTLIILWRSEGIIFLVFIPIMLLITYKKLRKPIFATLICAILILNSYIYKSALKKYEDPMYNLVIYINPLSIMLQQPLNGDVEEALANLDKVFSIEEIKKYPSYQEIVAYWEGNAIRENYKENADKVMRNVVKIILNNPISFISARLKTFIASSGMDFTANNEVDSRFLNLILFNEDSWQVKQIQNEYAGFTPINPKLKTGVETFLMGVIKQSENNIQITPIKVIFWNFLPILIIISILLIIKFIKKQWLIFTLCLSILAQAGIVFLTAPASYFMYYFPEYITGILIISICVFEYIKGVKNDRIFKEK